MQQQRIKELLQLYREASITEAELKELGEIISCDDTGKATIPVLKGLMEEAGDSATTYDPQRFDALFNQVLKVDKPAGIYIAAAARMQPDHRISETRRRPAIPWVRYAAAIILLAGVSSYLFFKAQRSSGKADKIQMASAKKLPDIGPGSNKAVLTLANGETVILDSAANGSLALQGNVHIQKLNDGELTYLNSNSNSLIKPGGYNSLVTPRGGQYSIVLPDGTRAWLNSASSLRYPVSFTGNIREVELSGEGYFEVAVNKKMPFRVKTGDVTVDVLGTAFNIMAYGNEETVNTTLVEGAVKVSDSRSDVLIQPGEQANSLNNKQGIRVQKAGMKEVLAWKNGEFRFKRSPIEYIMRQVERWYDVKVEYEQKMPNVQLSGMVPRKENISELLKIFEATKVVQFKIEDKKIIVSPFKK